MNPIASTDCEKAVLGYCITSGDVEVIESLSTEDFSTVANVATFEAVLECSRNGAVDIFAVEGELRQKNKIEFVGNMAGLLDMTAKACMPHEFASALRTLKASCVVRSTMKACEDIAQEIVRGNAKPDDLLSIAQQKILALASQTQKIPYVEIDGALREHIELLQTRESNDGKLLGVSTGYQDLDHIISGLQRHKLYVLAARPSMGKTALALNVASSLALKNITVLFFSLEMSTEELVNRLMISKSLIPANDYQGRKTPQRWIEILEHVAQVREWPIYINDRTDITIGEMRSIARMVKNKRQDNEMIIIVDYIQLIKSGSKRGYSRESEVAEISRGLKLIAKENGCAVVALSQLNRSLENREDKRPKLSDLRESGAIEQDADVVMFIYRDEIYNSECMDNKGTAEVLVTKNRSGPIGIVDMTFQAEVVRFFGVEKNHGGHSDYHTERDF